MAVQAFQPQKLLGREPLRLCSPTIGHSLVSIGNSQIFRRLCLAAGAVINYHLFRSNSEVGAYKVPDSLNETKLRVDIERPNRDNSGQNLLGGRPYL
jgi:hypothetical protein